MARIEDLVPNYLAIIKALFGFSYIWGFGGNLHDRYISGYFFLNVKLINTSYVPFISLTLFSMMIHTYL